jgi:adenosylcobinamide-GDP ribazoletransferase
MQINFKNEWQYCLQAFGALTRMSVGEAQPPAVNSHQDSSLQDLSRAATYFPLVGIVIGVVGAMSFYLASFLFPAALAVLIGMASTIYFTKAQHEDSLVKSVANAGSGREQALTSTSDLPKNMPLNGYAIATLFLVLFTKFQALSAMHPAFIPLILISGHALSQFFVVFSMAAFGKNQPQKMALLVALLFAVLPFLMIIKLLIAGNHTTLTIANFVAMTVLPMLAVWFFARAKSQKRVAEDNFIGNSYRDSLGAVQQLTELAFYLGALAWSLNLPS